MISNKKYVVLEHLTLPDRGFRFWSINTGNNIKHINGDIIYKEVLFTDDVDEAKSYSQKINREVIPTMRELEEYYKNKRYVEEE